MDLGLVHHCRALSRGGLWALLVWLYRRLEFKHTFVAGDSWTFEDRRPKWQGDIEETTPSVAERKVLR
jgi:hypothetical protein